jgi:hypothetical protein
MCPCTRAGVLPRRYRVQRDASDAFPRCLMTQPPAARSSGEYPRPARRSRARTASPAPETCAHARAATAWTWRWGRRTAPAAGAGSRCPAAQRQGAGAGGCADVSGRNRNAGHDRPLIGMQPAKVMTCSATTALGQETRQPPGNARLLDHRGRSVRAVGEDAFRRGPLPRALFGVIRSPPPWGCMPAAMRCGSARSMPRRAESGTVCVRVAEPGARRDPPELAGTLKSAGRRWTRQVSTATPPDAGGCQGRFAR